MSKISIIVPVYNASLYLNECIASLREQTYKDIEFVLVDDGSTDGSGAKCDSAAKSDPRFVVIHKANGGVSAARNDGIRIAKGKYIGFMDSDDRVEPCMFQKMLDRLEEEHADGVFCGFHQHGRAGQSNFIREATGDSKEAAWQLMTKDGYFTGPWSKLFSRESLLDAAGQQILFRSDLAIGEDEVWLHQVVANCKRIAFCPEKLYHWEVHPGSATANKTLPDSRMTVIKAKQETIRLVTPHGRRFVRLAKARMYKSLFVIRTQAYRWKEKEKLKIIKRAMRPHFWAWLSCDELNRGYKINTITMNAMMALHVDRRRIDKMLVMRDSWPRQLLNKARRQIHARMGGKK